MCKKTVWTRDRLWGELGNVAYQTVGIPDLSNFRHNFSLATHRSQVACIRRIVCVRVELFLVFFCRGGVGGDSMLHVYMSACACVYWLWVCVLDVCVCR